MAFADAFTNVEPAQNFNGDEGVQPGIPNGGVLPGSRGGTLNQLANTWNYEEIHQWFGVTSVTLKGWDFCKLRRTIKIFSKVGVMLS